MCKNVALEAGPLAGLQKLVVLELALSPLRGGLHPLVGLRRKRRQCWGALETIAVQNVKFPECDRERMLAHGPRVATHSPKCLQNN